MIMSLASCVVESGMGSEEAGPLGLQDGYVVVGLLLLLLKLLLSRHS